MRISGYLRTCAALLIIAGVAGCQPKPHTDWAGKAKEINQWLEKNAISPPTGSGNEKGYLIPATVVGKDFSAKLRALLDPGTPIAAMTRGKPALIPGSAVGDPYVLILTEAMPCSYDTDALSQDTQSADMAKQPDAKKGCMRVDTIVAFRRTDQTSDYLMFPVGGNKIPGGGTIPDPDGIYRVAQQYGADPVAVCGFDPDAADVPKEVGRQCKGRVALSIAIANDLSAYMTPMTLPALQEAMQKLAEVKLFSRTLSSDERLGDYSGTQEFYITIPFNPAEQGKAQ